MTTDLNDKVPEVPEIAFGVAERPFASAMRRSMLCLADYSREFENDLKLFNFCTHHGAAEETPEFARFDLQTWKAIAARDAVMNIYHFGQSVRALNAARARCHSLKTKFDYDLLKKANRLFESSFPDHEKIRHAISHEAEFHLDPKHHLKNQKKMSIAPGLTIEVDGELHFLTSIVGTTYQTVFGGEVLSCDIDHTTLEKLIAVKRAQFEAYRFLESLILPSENAPSA